MVPGAVDVLPLNVQLIVLPPLMSTQVSVSVGPVTPKFATAPVAGTGVTASVADADDPLYEAVTAAETVSVTTRVAIVNVALNDPAGTVTFVATVNGSPADREITAPPAGAGTVSVTVALIPFPPITVGALNDRVDTLAAAVTARAGDCLLVPSSDAVIVTVPAATAVIWAVPVALPAGIVSAAGTVAIAELLLDSATLTPLAGAAPVSVTVAWSTLPAATLAALRVTLDKAGDELGPVVDEFDVQDVTPSSSASIMVFSSHRQHPGD